MSLPCALQVVVTSVTALPVRIAGSLQSVPMPDQPGGLAHDSAPRAHVHSEGSDVSHEPGSQ